MLKQTKVAALKALKVAGAFSLMRDSRWRQDRLLILCYHGISLDDEHHWRPALYMAPSQLETRLSLLKAGGYNVLPLGEALQRLQAGSLPQRSVAITFDDGTYDFYRRAYPLLRRYGFPVTVYQTTYYSDHQLPVFNLMCSYLLWKQRGKMLSGGSAIGLDDQLDLRAEAGRQQIVRKLIAMAEERGLSGQEKNEIARDLASMVGVDYDDLASRRLLHVMKPEEVKELAVEGVDFQLHTHRHRTPRDRSLFQREIRENRDRLTQLTGKVASHFCFPSGVYDRQFLPWLSEEGVQSATTCDVGMVTSKDEPLLLPRFIDTTRRSDVEFESWLTGVGDLLAVRRAATQRYIPPPD
jgi:peptidoglycan/xylan/chitin deacetylase (PgdA/CDA1 family)